ncbi:Uncharacterised protein [Bordetella pertussis]|nr:Uncharacterised protein [Bordetella pertussis]
MVEIQRLGGLLGREVAHVAHERDDCAGLSADAFAQRRQQGGAVEIGFLDDNHDVQPPVTGSKTATSSPGRTDAPTLTCVWLTASFRRSAGSSCG